MPQGDLPSRNGCPDHRAPIRGTTVIFTTDRNGNPGHPTRRFDQVRKLVRRGEARIVGGGASGKPPVVVFFKKKFDSSKTIDRRFIVTIDPGYNTIGFAVCEVTGNCLHVLYKGEFKVNTSGIRKAMDERGSYRRRRRYISRLKKRRLSFKQKRPLTKFKKPRNIRSTNRISTTLRYGVQVHLGLYKRLSKYCPLPCSQVVKVMECNTFDVRTMTWGPANGKEYQSSPREKNEKVCVVCSSTENLQKHHLIQRKDIGTDLQENVVFLCKSCHGDAHAGRIYLPIKNIKQWRALGTMNAITGMLKAVDSIHFIPASDVAMLRRKMGLAKGHAEDAIAAAMVFAGCRKVTDTNRSVVLKKFRRHNRARIHAARDRLYKLDSKIVARNRRKRMNQKKDSLEELRIKHPKLVSKLRVYKGVRVF